MEWQTDQFFKNKLTVGIIRDAFASILVQTQQWQRHEVDIACNAMLFQMLHKSVTFFLVESLNPHGKQMVRGFPHLIKEGRCNVPMLLDEGCIVGKC